MLQNAQRDGAEFAWIPSGDSCAFCITLASRGWQKQGKAARQGIHAQHIHANCDCNYMVRFSEKTTVEGYDPDECKRMYDGAEGATPQEKINALRRAEYKIDREKLREQKKIAYARKHSKRIATPTEKELRARAQQKETVFGNWGVIASRIADGEYSLKYKHQRYLQHKRGTVQYIQTEKQRGRKQSYLIISEEEAQAYAWRYAGLGETGASAKNKVENYEFINADKIIGEYYEKGEWYRTNRMKIFHSKDGVHIVPVKKR